MSAYQRFKAECTQEIVIQGQDDDLAAVGRTWANLANARKYSYHFEWLGRPIIQYPQDILATRNLFGRFGPTS